MTAPRRIAVPATLILILLCGVFVRVRPWAAATGEGFDAQIYERYVNILHAGGIKEYPTMVEAYISAQRERPDLVLPPTRFLYIFCSSVWYEAFPSRLYDLIDRWTGWGGDNPDGLLRALRGVSTSFTIFTLLLTAAFAKRASGNAAMLGVTGLMAFAPLQIHMAQHALIDGFFAFWALLGLWALWENLRAPNRAGWLILYAASLAFLVMTKENAAFVVIAFAGLIAANHWLRFGTATARLALATAAGPLIGLAIVVALAGGPSNFIQVYTLLVQKAYVSNFAIRMCDGPWQTYLVDSLLVSPIIVLLAVGRLFQLSKTRPAEIYMVLFIAGSYLVMSNVKYSLNLRYASMWDMPLRYLAFAQLAAVSEHFGRWKISALAAAVIAICLVELHQYSVLCVQYPMYELVSKYLFNALKILK